MLFGGALIVDGLWVVVWGGTEIFIQGQLKWHPFPGGILTKPIRMTNTGMFYRLDTFYILFLWAMAVAYFCHLEFHENLGLLLSTITHIQYKICFHIKTYINIYNYNYNLHSYFIFKFDLNVKHDPIIFSNKNHVILYRKKTWKSYWIVCCKQMVSHAIWVTNSKVKNKKVTLRVISS